MGDQRGGQFVDAGVAGQRTAGQLREFPVIAARQTLAHLADMLQQDVVIIQQPFAGRPDIPSRIGGGGEPVLGVVQNPAGGIQPIQEGDPPPAAHGRRQPLAAGDRLSALGEMLGAEHLAGDGAGDQVLAAVRPAEKEARQELRRPAKSVRGEPRVGDARTTA